MQCKQLLESKDIEVVPPYMIAAKEAVKDFEKPKWTRKSNLPEVTKSWHNYMMKVKRNILFQFTSIDFYHLNAGSNKRFSSYCSSSGWCTVWRRDRIYDPNGSLRISERISPGLTLYCGHVSTKLICFYSCDAFRILAVNVLRSLKLYSILVQSKVSETQCLASVT